MENYFGILKIEMIYDKKDKYKTKLIIITMVELKQN